MVSPGFQVSGSPAASKRAEAGAFEVVKTGIGSVDVLDCCGQLLPGQFLAGGYHWNW